MGWFSKWILNRALGCLLRHAEKHAKDQFSDQQALDVRRYIEDRLHTIASREQRGWCKKTSLDDRGLRFVQIVLKSRWLASKNRYDAAISPSGGSQPKDS